MLQLQRETGAVHACMLETWMRGVEAVEAERARFMQELVNLVASIVTDRHVAAIAAHEAENGAGAGRVHTDAADSLGADAADAADAARSDGAHTPLSESAAGVMHAAPDASSVGLGAHGGTGGVTLSAVFMHVLGGVWEWPVSAYEEWSRHAIHLLEPQGWQADVDAYREDFRRRRVPRRPPGYVDARMQELLLLPNAVAVQEVLAASTAAAAVDDAGESGILTTSAGRAAYGLLSSACARYSTDTAAARRAAAHRPRVWRR